MRALLLVGFASVAWAAHGSGLADTTTVRRPAPHKHASPRSRRLPKSDRASSACGFLSDTSARFGKSRALLGEPIGCREIG